MRELPKPDIYPAGVHAYTKELVLNIQKAAAEIGRGHEFSNSSN